jgi:AraC-like DNA-binding protein
MTTNLSIKEIANQVGVHDDSHFVRDFQKTYGMSPRSFRRARRDPRLAGQQTVAAMPFQEEPPINRSFGQQISGSFTRHEAHTGLDS